MYSGIEYDIDDDDTEIAYFRRALKKTRKLV